MFCKKGILKNLVKFRGKHLWEIPFFNKDAGLRSALKQTFEELFPRTTPVAASYPMGDVICQSSKNYYVLTP